LGTGSGGLGGRLPERPDLGVMGDFGQIGQPGGRHLIQERRVAAVPLVTGQPAGPDVLLLPDGRLAPDNAALVSAAVQLLSR
jgi:hypothetical protein